MSMFRAYSSRGVFLVWRQGEGSPATATYAPRAKWQLFSLSRSFVWATPRAAAITAAAGALTAQSATVAGTAAHLTLHTATGALEAQAATVAGTAAAQAYQQIVLSLPTVIDITEATARGRVTATEYA